MSLMNAQCSVSEGVVPGSGLMESPVKALQGNERPPVIQTRVGCCSKAINGFTGIFTGDYGAWFAFPDFQGGTIISRPPAPETPYEWLRRRWELFTTLTQTYDCTDGTPEQFTGVSALSGNCPVSSGYPGRCRPLEGTSKQWGYWIPPGALINSGQAKPDTFSNTCLELAMAPAGEIISTLKNELSGTVDVAGIFAQTRAAFLARVWPAQWENFFLGFRDVQAQRRMDTTNVSPSDYNSSPQDSGPTSVSWPGVPGAAIVSGWTVYQGANDSTGMVSLFNGQARLAGTNRSTEVPYWIGRAVSAVYWGPDGLSSDYTGSISMVRTGMLRQGDVLGGNVDMPFPADEPFPIRSVRGAGVNAIFYFAVFGQDPTSWAKLYHQTFDPNPPA